METIISGVGKKMRRPSLSITALGGLILVLGFSSITSIGNAQPAVTRDSSENIKYIVMGTGTDRNLTIDGYARDFSCDTRIRIHEGQYNRIVIRNLSGTAGCPFIIENEGLTELNGEGKHILLSNLNHVIITGNRVKTIDKGFVIKNNPYRAIEIKGKVNNFSLKFFHFENIGDYVISYLYNEPYNPPSHSFVENLSFTHISCRSTGPFFVGGGFNENGDIGGAIKNFEIGYLDFQDAPSVGSIVQMANVENYNIHHNHVNNINSTNKNHNGVFMLGGNGRFYNNMVTNHQGNALRAWTFSIGSTPREVLIYNNIVYNSVKYSAFEVQSFDAFMTPGLTTYANTMVFHNTCGKMNTSRDWSGALIDVYNLQGGSCYVFNNLTFDFPEAKQIWTIQHETVPTGQNNLYFNTADEAGLVDVETFKLRSDSKAKTAGLANPYIRLDFYDDSRKNPPSIGAVE